MAAKGSEIAGEIDRIVSSPYPTQLKTLRDLLQSDNAQTCVMQWSLAKPCQIQPLTRSVLDGLQQWPYVLDIVAKLSYNRSARDSFLHQEPCLLNEIILQAVRTAGLDSPYTKGALAMLSHSLPKQTPMPADAQTLFVQTFDFAAQNPTAATLKSVYQLLRANSAHLLSILSGRVLVKLEDHIFEILRNVKHDTSSLSLYCLAVLRVLLGAANDECYTSISSYDTQELLASVNLSSSQKWTPSSISQFFAAEKAHKTLHLVVRRAMWACASSTGESIDERLESLQLAIEIIEAVDIEVRCLWRKSNALVVRKLEEKVTGAGLDQALRFRGLWFLMLVNKGGFSPTFVFNGVREILTRPAHFREAVVNSEESFMDQIIDGDIFDNTSTTAFLQNLVDFITSASSNDVLELNRSLRHLVGHLAALCPHNESVLEGVMLAIDVLSCGDKLQQLRGHAVGGTAAPNSNTPAMCLSAVRASYNGLTHALCKLFLTATMCSRQVSFSISHDTHSLLLALYAETTMESQSCSHAQRTRSGTDALLSMVQMPAKMHDTDSNWRQSLANHFSRKAQADRDTVTSIFHLAIADLETRCEDNEQPLIEERKLREAVQSKVDKLNQAYSDLERRCVDKDIQLSALEVERDRSVEDLRNAQSEIEDLTQKMEGLSEQLHDAKTQAEKANIRSKEAEEEIEMHHAATSARREEEVEQLKQELQRASEQSAADTVEIASLKGKVERQEAAIREGHAKKTTDEAALEECHSKIEGLEKKISNTVEQKADLEVQLQKKAQELSEAVTTHATEFENLKSSARVEMERILEQKSEAIAALRGECGRLTSSESAIKAEFDRSRRDLEHQTTRLEKRDRKIADLQRETHRLHRACEQKDRQIADASAMRNNLMMAMGLGGMRPQPPSSLPHRLSRASIAQPTQGLDADSQDPSPPTPFSGDDEETQKTNITASFASNTSSHDSRSGPTPKRAKVRRSIKVKTPAKQRLSVMSTRSLRPSTIGESRLKRQPLLTLGDSANNRRIAVDQTPGKGAVDQLDETTFDGSELFGGTQAGGS